MIITGAIVLAGLLWATSTVMVVQEKQDVVIQRFGKYIKTVNSPGLQFKLPWPLHSIATRVPTSKIETKEALKTKTKDDIFVELPIKMHMEVEDSKKFCYEARDPMQQAMSRIAATVKQQASQMEFADLFSSREEISANVRDKVGEELKTLYGIRLVDVIVDEPQAPKEIQDSYNQVKASQRQRMAAENEAEAEKIKTIAAAQARKEASKLDGEGIAAMRAAIFKNYSDQFNELARNGMTHEQAHDVIMSAMSNDTIRDAAHKGNVILATTGGNSSSEVLKEVLAANKAAAAAKGGAAPAA
jgi:regulator of protease activity HflC (stomatin/prohibitin superfamily)